MSNLCSEITLPTGVDHRGRGADRGLLPVVAQPGDVISSGSDDAGHLIEDIMRFLDNVLGDFIEKRAPDSMAARALFGDARALGRVWAPWASIPSCRPAAFRIESVMAKVWNGQVSSPT